MEGDMAQMIDSFKRVWNALADTPKQAVNLRARVEFMRQITDCHERERMDSD